MNQLGASKTDMLMKLLLIFFISLLSFSVGTYVGKQFSDSEHKLAAMEHDGDRETASVSPDATHMEPDNALSEEDMASLSEEFVKSKKDEETEAHPDRSTATVPKDAHGDTHKADHGDTKADHGAAAHHNDQDTKQAAHGKVEKVVGTVSKNSAHDAHAAADDHGAVKGHGAVVSEAAHRVAQGHTPDPEPKAKEPNRIPTSLPNQVTAQNVPKFFIQVASYAKEDEALKRVDVLKEQGFSAYTVKNAVGGKSWYRVAIGAFASQNEADDGLKKVRTTPGLSDAFIQKIVK